MEVIHPENQQGSPKDALAWLWGYSDPTVPWDQKIPRVLTEQKKCHSARSPLPPKPSSLQLRPVTRKTQPLLGGTAWGEKTGPLTFVRAPPGTHGVAFHPFTSGFANLIRVAGAWSELTASLQGPLTGPGEPPGAGWLGGETDHRAIPGPSTLRGLGQPWACGSTAPRRRGARSLAGICFCGPGPGCVSRTGPPGSTVPDPQVASPCCSLAHCLEPTQTRHQRNPVSRIFRVPALSGLL